MEKLSTRDRTEISALLSALQSGSVSSLIEIYQNDAFRHLATPILAERAIHMKDIAELQQVLSVSAQSTDFSLAQCMALFLLDYEQIRVDLGMLRSALAKAPQVSDLLCFVKIYLSILKN